MVINPQKVGTNVRMSFSKIKEVLDMPNLLEVQKKSYKSFIEEGLMEVLRDVSPITDYAGNLIIEFVDSPGTVIRPGQRELVHTAYINFR